MFHFVSGYTAKVAGTEEGVIEPEATFFFCMFWCTIYASSPNCVCKNACRKS